MSTCKCERCQSAARTVALDAKLAAAKKFLGRRWLLAQPINKPKRRFVSERLEETSMA
jgi:hypothetical protein